MALEAHGNIPTLHEQYDWLMELDTFSGHPFFKH